MNILFSILFLLLLAALAHPLGQAIPGSAFHAEWFPFFSFGWEKSGKIYKKFHIEKWKDKLPDASKYLSDMIPKKVIAPSAESIDILITETCRAEFVHWCEIVLSFGCYAISPGIGGGIAVAVWVLLGNLPFIIIQRYNRPRLVKLRGRLQASNAKKERNYHEDITFELQHG